MAITPKNYFAHVINTLTLIGAFPPHWITLINLYPCSYKLISDFQAGHAQNVMKRVGGTIPPSSLASGALGETRVRYMAPQYRGRRKYSTVLANRFHETLGFAATEFDKLRKFYESVEITTQELIATTCKQELNCKRGCGGCCVDGLSVSHLEAEYIYTFADRSKVRQPISVPAAEVVLVDPALDAAVREDGGRCAFLAKDNSCTIYEHRPYVCRHFGLPLRWDLGENDGHCQDADEMHEGRDICPLNEECLGAPIEELPAAQCFPVDEVWETLDMLQAPCSGGTEEQGVALRDLHNAIIADVNC